MFVICGGAVSGCTVLAQGVCCTFFSLEVRLCEGNACVCLRFLCGFHFHLRRLQVLHAGHQEQVHYPDAWQNCLLWCLCVFVWMACLCLPLLVFRSDGCCYCYWLRCSGFCLRLSWVQKWLCKSCLVKTWIGAKTVCSALKGVCCKSPLK